MHKAIKLDSTEFDPLSSSDDKPISFAFQCEWTKEIFRELAKDGRDFDNTVVIVCGNKSDDAAAKKRQVDDIEARLWAELRWGTVIGVSIGITDKEASFYSRGFPYFETSAFSGEGITDMFHAFFSQIGNRNTLEQR